MKGFKYVLVALIAATSLSSFSASAKTSDGKNHSSNVNGDVYTCIEVNGKLVCVKR